MPNLIIENVSRFDVVDAGMLSKILLVLELILKRLNGGILDGEVIIVYIYI